MSSPLPPTLQGTFKGQGRSRQSRTWAKLLQSLERRLFRLCWPGGAYTIESLGGRKIALAAINNEFIRHYMHPVYRQNTTNHRKFVRKNISNSLANVILPKDTLTQSVGVKILSCKRFCRIVQRMTISVKLSVRHDN